VTPDLYGAWLTAGSNLQPVGAWIGGHWVWLAVAASAVFSAWVWLDAILDDHRTRNDHRTLRAAAYDASSPEPPQPGTDIGLYLACVAAFNDCDELDRLRDAINQHRTGDTNG
jgi:hypothetical protein